MISETALAAKVGLGELAVAVRVLGLVFVEEALVVVLDHTDRVLFGLLPVFVGQHGHLVGVNRHPVVVIDHWLHRLLVILPTVVTVQVVNLAGALAEFAVEALVDFALFEGRRAVVGVVLHVWRQTSPLGAWLRDRALSVLIFLVCQLDLRLDIVFGVGVYLGNFVDCRKKVSQKERGTRDTYWESRRPSSPACPSAS